MRRRRTIAESTIIVMIFAAAPVVAGTTGQLSGHVVDAQAIPLEGVSVTAGSPAQIGQPQVTVTDNRGFFAYPRLAPGYYTVHLRFEGFVFQELTEVQVRVDRVTEVRVTLPQSSFAGEVLVLQTTPVVDPSQVSTGQTYPSDYISETASTWQDLIQQTAGTSPYNFRRMLGSTPQDNTFLLDGSDATNWYDRYPNLAAAGLPFDAMQEVALHTAGFEAEYGQATGGVVNVLTKSGGNLFTGTLDLRHTDSGLEESGNHYDPDEQESQLSRFSVTLGGPILRDRLWFFATIGRSNHKNTPTGAPTTLDSEQQVYMGKLTWKPSADWSLVGMTSYAPSKLDNVGSSQFRAADATSTWENDPAISSLDLVGVLSPRALWGLRLGRKKFDHTELPADGDLETIGHVNLDTDEYYGNLADQWYGESSQLDMATDLTWFAHGPVGTHEVKVGLGYGEPKFTGDECFNGGGRCTAGVDGFFFRDVIGEAGENLARWMVINKAEGPVDLKAAYRVAYLQDAWRLRSNLTLKLGLRWDRVSYHNNTGEVADLSKLQPRIGAAWDPSGNGRSILRASWGRFMHPGTGILADVTSESYPRETWTSCTWEGSERDIDPGMCPAIAGMYGWEWRADPEGWDAAGWFLNPANIEGPHRAVDDLRAGYADEWVIGFEHELAHRTAVEVSFIHKESRDLFDDTCSGNIPEPTPGSRCDHLIVANLPQIRFDYQAWMLRFETRALEWLHLLASWVVSNSEGSMAFNTSTTTDFNVYPYHFENRYGYLEDHSRHRVKLNGYLLLPYDFTVALNGWWDSEYRWTPLDTAVPEINYGAMFLEPRGSGKTSAYHQLDLQLGKGFDIGRTHLELIASVINALDSENTWEVCRSVTGCGDYEMGDTIAWQQPRRYELGFRVEF